MTTKDTAYQAITALIECFAKQLRSCRKKGHYGTLARRDFIDPFFKALSWNIGNAQGYPKLKRMGFRCGRRPIVERVENTTISRDEKFKLWAGKKTPKGKVVAAS